MATKAELQHLVGTAWQALESAVNDLSELEMEQTGVLDGWSVKDLLGHIAFWDQQAAVNLGLIAAGKVDQVMRPQSPGDTDQWNQREWRKRQGQPLAAVQGEWRESHRQVLEALAAFPEEKLSLDVGGRTAQDLLAEDTHQHYREHLAQIAQWRREVETTEA